MTTEAQLRRAEDRFQRVHREVELARDARNAEIGRALEQGWTHSRVAEVTGLTRGRIGQIAANGGFRAEEGGGSHPRA